MEHLSFPTRGFIEGSDGMTIHLRPAESGDHPFLFDLFTSTRIEEVSARGWDILQQQAFMRLQYRAQQWQYQGEFTQVEDYLVLDGEEPIGRFLISHEKGYIQLADITLLESHRNKGIGTGLVKALQAKAARSKKAIRLNVVEFNRAIALFERLGFKVVGEHGHSLEMEWQPPSSRLPVAKKAKASQRQPARRSEQG
jgi:GNAT superfamily N-acetyltransferase